MIAHAEMPAVARPAPAPNHHPADEWLLGAATGTLPAGHGLVLDVHLERCAACRERVRLLESAGGAWLEALPEAALRPDALAETLRALDAGPAASAPARPAPAKASNRPPAPAGMAWPQALAGCTVSDWRWIGPGMRWSRVELPGEPEANLLLLRIGAGRYLPSHTHSGIELTQVLHGSFDDGRARFGPGDFDATDPTVRHQPAVAAGGECVCLASVDGRLVFDGWLARTLAGWMGL